MRELRDEQRGGGAAKPLDDCRALALIDQLQERLKPFLAGQKPDSIPEGHPSPGLGCWAEPESSGNQPADPVVPAPWTDLNKDICALFFSRLPRYWRSTLSDPSSWATARISRRRRSDAIGSRGVLCQNGRTAPSQARLRIESNRFNTGLYF